MPDRPEVVAAADHALGEQKPGGQLAICAGRAHDHRERAIVQPDLERLLGGRGVGLGAALAAAHANHLDGRNGSAIALHLTRYDAAHGQAQTGSLDRRQVRSLFENHHRRSREAPAPSARPRHHRVWALLGPLFRFSDTWQLVINTGTTIITFLMVFLIQRSQNKDSLAIHLKLNEIVAAVQGASNRLVDVESLSEKELETLHRHYGELAKLARSAADVTESHSVEEARARHSAKDEDRGAGGLRAANGSCRTGARRRSRGPARPASRPAARLSTPS